MRVPSNSKNIRWLCRCDCGTERVLSGQTLRTHGSKSCGCMTNGPNSVTRTHGLSQKPGYAIWSSMRARCYSENNPAYPKYGGRGITICDEWRDTPKLFLDWLYSNGWQKGYEVDRIDNDKGYSPDNCRVTNRRGNVNNRRNTILVDYQGRRQSLSDWCIELKLDYRTTYLRIFSRGWDVERAFTTPKMNQGAQMGHIKHGGRRKKGRSAPKVFRFSLMWT